MSIVELPEEIYGVDFSGAKDAGKWIWISKGIADGECLLIKRCFRAVDLPGSGKEPEKCLPALRDYVARHARALFGFDFPFGLPKELVKQTRWEEFILAFPSEYRSANDLRRICFSKAGNRELKRLTDLQNRAPFSPYNIRVYRQTYYGITKIIYPLVRDDLGCILPMQRPKRGKPWVLEVCPASTLKSEGLYGVYKNRRHSGDQSHVRYHILSSIQATGQLKLAKEDMIDLILADCRGDALDSLVAAFVAFRTLKKGIEDQRLNCEYEIEGFIFV